jgi:hypothetical protein
VGYATVPSISARPDLKHAGGQQGEVVGLLSTRKVVADGVEDAVEQLRAVPVMSRDKQLDSRLRTFTGVAEHLGYAVGIQKELIAILNRDGVDVPVGCW